MPPRISVVERSALILQDIVVPPRGEPSECEQIRTEPHPQHRGVPKHRQIEDAQEPLVGSHRAIPVGVKRHELHPTPAHEAARPSADRRNREVRSTGNPRHPPKGRVPRIRHRRHVAHGVDKKRPQPRKPSHRRDRVSVHRSIRGTRRRSPDGVRVRAAGQLARSEGCARRKRVHKKLVARKAPPTQVHPAHVARAAGIIGGREQRHGRQCAPCRITGHGGVHIHRDLRIGGASGHGNPEARRQQRHAGGRDREVRIALKTRAHDLQRRLRGVSMITLAVVEAREEPRA